MKIKTLIMIVVIVVGACIGAIFVFLFTHLSYNPQFPKVSESYQTPTPSITPTPVATVVVTPTTTTNQNTCNSLLVLVDKTYGLSSTYAPPDLVDLGSYGIPVISSSLQGRLIEVPELVDMMNASKTAGVSLVVVSPYRSYATQAALHAGYVAANGPVDADTYSALPGHSQHQLGTAIDFSTPSIGDQLEQTFEQTPAGSWLAANAYKYGFYIAYPDGQTASTGYEYEPWHFRYIGLSNALLLKNSGQNMEQYLLKYGVLPNC
jgi:D-alanyl-D-alanine carboxypeptidase